MEQNTDLLKETSKIVTSHVGNNHVDAKDLPTLIRDVYKALETAAGGSELQIENDMRRPPLESNAPAEQRSEPRHATHAHAPEPVALPPMKMSGGGNKAPAVTQHPVAQHPAVDPLKSVFPDFIICLEDGRRLRTLKRHLATSFNLTPDEYRAKWGLPDNYPMVAPNYSEQRSSMAKSNRLGHHRAGRKIAESQSQPEPGKRGEPAIKRIPEGVSALKRRAHSAAAA